MEEHEKYKIAVQALKDIMDPIEKLKREMPKGYSLDGPWAVAYASSIVGLKEIARDALRELGEETI